MTGYKTEFMMISACNSYNIGTEGTKATVLNREVRKLALRRQHLSKELRR